MFLTSQEVSFRNFFAKIHMFFAVIRAHARGIDQLLTTTEFSASHPQFVLFIKASIKASNLSIEFFAYAESIAHKRPT